MARKAEFTDKTFKMYKVDFFIDERDRKRSYGIHFPTRDGAREHITSRHKTEVFFSHDWDKELDQGCPGLPPAQPARGVPA